MIAFASPHFVIPALELAGLIARCVLALVWAGAGLGGSAALELAAGRAR